MSLAEFQTAIATAHNLGKQAIDTWGAIAQEIVAIEEMGELITVLARYKRGRASQVEVISECADVIATVIQLAMIYRPPSDARDDLNGLTEALDRKMARLHGRILTAESENKTVRRKT